MSEHTESLPARWSRLLARMPDSTGIEAVTAFETALAEHFGVCHAVALASGTAALHTALVGMGVGPGDEVLVPALSVPMSVAPIIHCGARPVFVDSSPDGTLDLDDLTAKTTTQTAAVLAVHLWGRPGDVAGLSAWSDEHDIPLIEDACQAQGTRLNGRHAGTFGRVGCFSLKDGKILWSGEGGYLLTNDDDLPQRCRTFRSHGTLTRQGTAVPGYNYRLAEPLAVLARFNLDRFPQLLQHRQDQADRLATLLNDAPGIEIHAAATTTQCNGYALLARVHLPDPRRFLVHLASQDVPNSVGTFGLISADQRPAFAAHQPHSCPRAAAYIDRTLAVILTDHDDDQRLTTYAHTIVREAHLWQRRA